MTNFRFNPDQPQCFDVTTDRKELFATFAMFVAAKNAHTMAVSTERFFQALAADLPKVTSPFTLIQLATDSQLLEAMQLARVGQYRRFAVGLRQLAKLDMENVTVEQLEQVTGVGMKTARFIALNVSRGVECAALDVHVNKFLRECGHNAPEATPSGNRKEYLRLEALFVQEARERGVTCQELDLEVWLRFRKATQDRRVA